MKTRIAGMHAAVIRVGRPALLPVTAAAAAKGDAAAGKDVFTKRCAMCHGPEASGDTPMAKALGATIPDYRSKTVQDLKDDEIKEA